MRVAVMVMYLTSLAGSLIAQTVPPIIDMHLHASPLEWFPRRPLKLCAGGGFPPVDRRGVAPQPSSTCERLLAVPSTNDELMRSTLAVLERRNIVAVTIGPLDQLRRWKAAAAGRIIPALLFAPTDAPVFHPTENLDSGRLRELFTSREIQILGEVESQYQGVGPSDPLLEPILALAEELDIPVGIHVGAGPVGAAYGRSPKYRAALGNPLLLEEALVRHPNLRLYVMHAGWPLLDEMILLLQAHPQVYVDISVIDWILPRREFHGYLRRLVEAGFGMRVMFGSDMFLSPAIIDVAIEAVESADFLTAEQKRDILYNNAARFLRLDAAAQKN